MKTRDLQKALNIFTKKYVAGVSPLLVDGKKGKSTTSRIKLVKFYLGYTGKVNDTVDLNFRSRMWHPKSVQYSTPARVSRGIQRRRKKRADWKKNIKAGATKGVGYFDGKPVANWLIPYLKWARANGWRGTLVSGWRDPVYSEGLCMRICGRPSCPGRCAGRSSNHSGSVKPHGAVDVSDYDRFFQLMRQCPLQPRIFNSLGSRDPVHGSATGS